MKKKYDLPLVLADKGAVGALVLEVVIDVPVEVLLSP